MDYPNLSGQIVGFDTETTGLGAQDRAFGFSVATERGSWYFDLRRDPQAASWFSEQSPSMIVCHNASFDYRMATAAGMRLDVHSLDDTVIRACLLNEHLMSYSLDDLSLACFGERKQAEIYSELAQLFGGRATRNVQMRNIAQAPPEIVAPYARRDAELVLRLWLWQQAEIKRQGIEQIVQFERSLMPTLIRAEQRGIRVDLEAVEPAQQRLTVEIDQSMRKLESIAGRGFNVNSTVQVRNLFKPQRTGKVWVADNGIELESTGGGQPSMDAQALRRMTDDPRAQLILSIRSLIKTRDTFLGKHILASAVGDRVYPSINQSKSDAGGTATGRLSYTNPAMQQIPSRNKEVAQIVKALFLPEPGHVWVDADLNSFEIRVFAHLINDPKICEMYRTDRMTDFHQAVADLTGLPRNATYSGQPNAKQLNLSMVFNSGNGAIAETMGMDWHWDSFDKGSEKVAYKKAGPAAMAVIENYHRMLPGVKELADRAKSVATDRGYVRTRFGRRIRFPNPRFSYKASGLLIQATAADINKHNWTVIDQCLEPFGGHIILNTHDSYSLSVPEGDWQRAWTKVQSEVENAYPWFRIPLVLELSGHGRTWWDAIKGS